MIFYKPPASYRRGYGNEIRVLEEELEESIKSWHELKHSFKFEIKKKQKIIQKYIIEPTLIY